MNRIDTKSIITPGACFISCVSQVLSAFITEPCGSVQPIYGMVLKRHVFQSMKTLNSHHCSKECDKEIRCQSFNYFVTKEICELNNRTREARLDDLVEEKDGLYMKRFNKRGRYVILIQTVEGTLGLQMFKEREVFRKCKLWATFIAVANVRISLINVYNFNNWTKKQENIFCYQFQEN